MKFLFLLFLISCSVITEKENPIFLSCDNEIRENEWPGTHFCAEQHEDIFKDYAAHVGCKKLTAHCLNR